MRRAVAGDYRAPGGATDASVRDGLARGLANATLAELGSELAIAYSGPRVPRTAACGVVCVLNGYVYNLGAIARSAGDEDVDDPELVLALAYADRGVGLLEDLRGDFAVLFWDTRVAAGLIARDQLGGKSIYLHIDGDRVRFASELRELLGMLPSRPAVDELSLTRWLADTCLPRYRTLYEGVRRLGPGEYLEFGDGPARPRAYWRPRYVSPQKISMAEVVERAKTGMEDAVRARLDHSRQTGVLVSGGLDSTTVAGVTQGEAGQMRGYSAAFPAHPEMDESEWIALAHRELGLGGAVLQAKPVSFLAGALEYLRAWELPVRSPNHAVWQPLLRHARADGIEVMLDGEGGDELWEPSAFLIADRLVSGRLLSARSLSREIVSQTAPVTTRNVRRALRQFGFKGAVPHWAHSAIRRRHALRHAPSWFSERSARALFEVQDPWEWKRLDGPRWWRSFAWMVTGVREQMGAREYLRHKAELAGLEERHPFVDLDLIGLVLSMPPEYAFGGGISRPVMRAAIRGAVPEQIRQRRDKPYFNHFLRDCLTRDLPQLRRLLGRDAEVRRFMRADAMDRLLTGSPDQHPEGWQAWTWEIWTMAAAECWLRHQEDPESLARLVVPGAGEAVIEPLPV